MFTPNELVGFLYLCASIGENPPRNASVRVHAHRLAHEQRQTGFIICSMLYAIAMGQIIRNPKNVLQLDFVAHF